MSRDESGHRVVTVSGMRLLETVPMSLVVAVVTAAVTYGAMSARVETFEREITTLNANLAVFREKLEARQDRNSVALTEHRGSPGHQAVVEMARNIERLLQVQVEGQTKQMDLIMSQVRDMNIRVRELERRGGE